jgi:tellurite resistance protein TerC
MCTFPLWAFALMIAIFLGVDMLMHRKAHEISMREALLSSAFWIGLALLFNLWIWHCRGTHDALLFLTAYLVEESLSIDNLFVFLLIFKYFHVPSRYLHKVLFWGIFGAIVFRALFIVGGLALISHVEWVLYLFALFLIYAGIKLALEKDQKIDPAANPILGYLSRHFKVTHDSSTGKFIDHGALTPLFFALVAVETSDILFALDSIPAVFAITRDPFLVYTSNIFAILGLRSLFFSVKNLLDTFHHLHYGLAFILTFIGFKMLLEPWIHLPIGVTLGIIALTLLVSIAASLKKSNS